MLSTDNVVREIPCDNRKLGEHVLQLRMLREGPANYAMNPEKIRDLWIEARKHKVLFSDYTEGKLEPFMDVIMDVRGVWLEICDEEENILGAVYLSDVIPGFDAYGHFTFWDSIASGREPIVLYGMEFVMDRYQLHRMSALIPAYQKGVIRFAEKLGFKREGKIREAVIHKGAWMDAYHYGILRREVDEMIERIW